MVKSGVQTVDLCPERRKDWTEASQQLQVHAVNCVCVFSALEAMPSNALRAGVCAKHILLEVHVNFLQNPHDSIGMYRMHEVSQEHITISNLIQCIACIYAENACDYLYFTVYTYMFTVYTYMFGCASIDILYIYLQLSWITDLSPWPTCTWLGLRSWYLS